MDAKEALTRTRTKAEMEMEGAKAGLDHALNHLQDLLGRVRKEAEAGQYYGELNLARASADVSRMVERCSGLKDQISWAQNMLDDL